MSFRPLTDSSRQTNDCDTVVDQQVSHSDIAAFIAGDEETIEQLLDSARNEVQTRAWAVYRSGEELHLVGQGDPQAQWPSIVSNDEFDAFCRARHLHRWPTGRGESVLGWLLAPGAQATHPTLAEFARRLGTRLQADALARAQITQRVLYEIIYLASSTRERSVLWSVFIVSWPA